MIHALALTLLLQLPSTPLPSTQGPRALATEVKGHPFTAVLFWSWPCPVVRSHDARFAQLVKDFSPQGVHFVLVDSQADATLEHATDATNKRSYTLPIVLDTDSTWADALAVKFSATLVVLDEKGTVRYRGGLDSDRVKLTDDFTPHARLALTALLAGQEPPERETKGLGCVLRRH